ncbi:MAG TPA: CPBP family intramembrane glutamic endopeptidase [Polyangia bacterium]
MARAAYKKQGNMLRRSDPLTSLLLVFPLFVVYQIGVLSMPSTYNGADLVTSQMLHLLHGNARTYFLINVALALAFVVLVLILRKKNTFDPRLFVPVLFESAIYALTMGSLICFVMIDLLHIDPKLAIACAAGPEQASPAAKVVLSLGAGVHEEILFRLIMVGGGVWLFERAIGLRRWLSIALAFAVSSVLFSAAHHVIGGEPFRVGAFTYRVLCGLVFATIFQTRGFAVAVYTHALYDIYVLLVRG